jgi:hypothetical protein
MSSKTLASLLCLGILVGVAPKLANAQTVLFQDDFESGAAQWTLQGSWHLTPAVCGIAPESGSMMARFGQVGSCWFFGKGRMINAVPIDLPATAQAARLRFNSYEETECGGGNCGWDHRTIFVSTNAGSSWTLVWQGAAEHKWLEKSVDLTPYLGQSVSIAFEFDDIDPLWNDFRGWMLDDVQVVVDEPGGPTVYCTPKVNSQGCTPLMGYSGDPSLSGPDDLVLSTSSLRNNIYGSFAWSTGINNVPFQGGTLCVQIPARRTATISTGGAALPWLDCSGVYSWNFTHEYLVVNGIEAGETVYCQYFGRDVGSGSPMTLSDAVRVTILP